MNKVIIFLMLNFLFSIQSLCQTDTIFVEQVNDSTFREVVINYDENDREVSKKVIYFDSLSFYNYLFEAVLETDKQSAKGELKAIEILKSEKKKKKVFKEMKTFYTSFTNRSYETVLDSLLKSQILGDWKLVVSDTLYNIKLTNNWNKFKDIDSTKKMKVSYQQFSKLEIKQGNDDPFFLGDAILLEERDKNGERIYKGYLSDGTKVVLKR